MKLIPISREYHRGYEKVRWDVDDLGVVVPVKDVRGDLEPCTKVYPPVGWVLPKCNYQGC